MARKAGDIIEGRDLMMYINTATGGSTATYTPQAAATSHTITYSGETKERVTKDTANGAYGEKKVTKLSVSIKCEALVSFGDAAGYDKLLEAMKSREPVKLKYGFSQEESGDKYEEGLFVITSLEQTSAAGEDATYSATFENSGAVETKTKTSA
ncbi:MAG: phage tail protein [Parabacteroides sp.]|nr:phage tail protein [Parabacteroides sp.]